MQKYKNQGFDFMYFTYFENKELNIFGKSVLTPIIIITGVTMAIFDFLFIKD